MSDALRNLTVTQLRKRLAEKGIAIPTKGSGKNGSVLKTDLVELLQSQSVSDAVMRDYLPNEMVMQIALQTPEDTIGALCRTDRNLAVLCHELSFWRAYFSTHDYGRTLHALLLSAEDDPADYELFRWLWKNGESFGEIKNKELYEQLSTSIKILQDKKERPRTRPWLWEEAARGIGNHLLLYLWKYAPLSERSRFHPEVVAQLNDFLKRWMIIPQSSDVDDFYFRAVPPENAEELGIDPDDDIYFEETQDLEEIDKEAAEEFRKLSKLTLFTGDYFELISPALFHAGPHMALIKTHDKVSRSFIKNTKRSVGEVLQQAAYVGFDPYRISGGIIKSVEIDKNAFYPTLIINFEPT